ncbi:MAG: hypothetical protein ACYCPO_05595 [Acidobacteriaceae bacterium]
MTFKDEEIDEIIKEDTRLPSTHRRGYPSSTDDVAEAADGMPTKVPTSGTPDERYMD